MTNIMRWVSNMGIIDHLKKLNFIINYYYFMCKIYINYITIINLSILVCYYLSITYYSIYDY